MNYAGVVSIALLAVLVLGVNTLFWSTVGIVRATAGKVRNHPGGVHRYVFAHLVRSIRLDIQATRLTYAADDTAHLLRHKPVDRYLPA